MFGILMRLPRCSTYLVEIGFKRVRYSWQVERLFREDIVKDCQRVMQMD